MEEEEEREVEGGGIWEQEVDEEEDEGAWDGKYARQLCEWRDPITKSFVMMCDGCMLKRHGIFLDLFWPQCL